MVDSYAPIHTPSRCEKIFVQTLPIEHQVVVSLVVFGDEDVVTARREGSVRLDSDSPAPVVAVDDPPARVQPHVDDRLPQAVDPPVALKPLVAEAVGEDLRIQQGREIGRASCRERV